MPWSTFFLDAFLAAGTEPVEISCTSKAEARRRQRQFHSFRRDYRDLCADRALLQKLNAIVVRVDGTTVILLTQKRLRAMMVEELEAQLARRRKARK